MFEALLIYIACWCENWKLSDLYGKESEKYLVTGANPLFNAKSRIQELRKYGIPIESKRIDAKSLKKGSNVSLNRQEIIEDFKSELGLESEKEIDSFESVISLAIPLLWIQITCYQNSQTFANEDIRSTIENFILMMGSYPNCVKYFPIWLSFNPNILSQNGFVNGEGRKWELVYTHSNALNLPSRVMLNFFWEIPGLKESMEKVFPSSAYINYPSKFSMLENQLKRFKDAFRTKTDGSLGYIDDEFENFVLLLRLTRKTIDQIIPGKFDYYQKNKKTFNLRIQILNKIILDFLLLPVLSPKNIDFKGKIQIKVDIPGVVQPFVWNIPLNDIYDDFTKASI